jgi:hypothetical protein
MIFKLNTRDLTIRAILSKYNRYSLRDALSLLKILLHIRFQSLIIVLPNYIVKTQPEIL